MKPKQRMKLYHILAVLLLGTSVAHAQKMKPRMVKNYWYFNYNLLRSQGYHYADDFNGETTLEH